MLEQLQSMQADMVKAQEEIAELSVTATAGGGAVSAVVTGERRVASIAIDPEVVDPEDVEMLQDLVTAAVNEGLAQVEQQAADRMSAVTGDIDVPGIL